jgi:hypothetical protein
MIGADRASVGDIGDLGAPNAARDQTGIPCHVGF